MEIEHRCPQCDGPVILDESDRLLVCPFCKTKLCIKQQDCLRYCFTPSDPFLEDVLFVPYWRFRGIHLQCKTSGITDTVIDRTFLAIDDQCFKPTLGIRPQSLRLRFARPMENARFIMPKTAFDITSVETKRSITYKMITVRETRLVPAANRGDYVEIPFTKTEIKEEKVYHEAFIADTLSLVYTPVFMRNDRLYDAVINEPLGGPPMEGPLPYETYSGAWDITFLPTICPNCGWDTIAERDSIVLLCNKCNSAWEAGPDGLRPVSFTCAMPAVSPKNAPLHYLPFWRILADIEGIELNCYADLIRLSNLPKVVKPEWEQPPLFLWTPAFKMSPGPFIRIAKQFIIALFDGETSGTVPDSSIHPVNLPLQDAIESLTTIIADLAINKKEVFPLLPDMRITVREALLVLFPFTETSHEYIQPEIKCGLMKNSLQWGRKI